MFDQMTPLLWLAVAGMATIPTIVVAIGIKMGEPYDDYTDYEGDEPE